MIDMPIVHFRTPLCSVRTADGTYKTQTHKHAHANGTYKVQCNKIAHAHNTDCTQNSYDWLPFVHFGASESYVGLQIVDFEAF